MSNINQTECHICLMVGKKRPVLRPQILVGHKILALIFSLILLLKSSNKKNIITLYHILLHFLGHQRMILRQFYNFEALCALMVPNETSLQINLQKATLLRHFTDVKLGCVYSRFLWYLSICY